MKHEKIISNWRHFFEKKGISVEFRKSYMLYVEYLVQRNLPVIFEIEHLSRLLGRTNIYLNSVVYSSSSHYRYFKLKKRTGSYREIAVPYPALLECQYWIYKNILQNVKINNCAHGFARKKSIITNAKIHVGSKELLKIDIKDYFPSITKNRGIAMFHRLGYPADVSFYLGSICCLADCLPQGAPTSPTISNIVSQMLDKRLFALAKKFDFKYTRYADDLAFSGESIPVKFIDYVNVIIKDEGFMVNTDKTKLYKNSGKRILTGVSISTNKLKAPKSYKRDLFQELHYIDKFGLNSHMSKRKIRNPYYLNSLIGKLNYIISIEPDCKKARDYLVKLIKLDKEHTHNRVDGR